MLASAAGRAAIHAVRVQIIPAPRSLADSREILRILQNYGEISTYRWLKHDALSSAPNSAMAIFSDGEAMTRFVRDCPLTFEIKGTEREETVFDELPDEDTEFSESSAGPPVESAADQELSRTGGSLKSSKPSSLQTPTTYLTRPQLFRINADIWRGKHREWLERHPFWGNFKPNTNSIVQQDLRKRVPLVGLSDIDANGKNPVPLRILGHRKEDLSKRPTLKDMIRDLRGDEPGEMQNRDTSTGHWG